MGRVNAHYPLLDRRGIKYRLPDFDNIYDRNVYVGPGEAVAAPTLPVEGITVRYTQDGTSPDRNSPLYTGPISFDSDRVLKFRTFYPDGSPGDITVAPYYGVEPFEAVDIPEGELSPGLIAALYAFEGESSRDIATSPYIGEFVTPYVTIPDGAALPIGLIYTGYIDIPEDGIYTFYLNTDDGSMLYIHGEPVVDNDGMHSILEKTGQAALWKGLHPIEVHYFDPNGGSVELGIIDDDNKRRELGPSWFRH
ncbi:MAG: chitobiase/beta-hexosaminidase C-terminal domain-containing protein [Rikenellaceae bacterium]|nr:chitobiase/beta-hexosaminidase C-terminal domain-containing protein [Rikenellaceae bacterium]